MSAVLAQPAIIIMAPNKQASTLTLRIEFPRFASDRAGSVAQRETMLTDIARTGRSVAAERNLRRRWPAKRRFDHVGVGHDPLLAKWLARVHRSP
jgi:hypothetical protein